MKHIHLDKIKNYESPPKIVNIFSEKEIKIIQQLYTTLPETAFNKKQNIRKKRWIQNYNRELDKIYFDKIKDVLGDFKMDNLKSETGEDFYGLYHESFLPLPLHVDTGFNEEDIIFKQVVTPLSSFGDTVVFKNRWYGKSTSFTIDADELKFTEPLKEKCNLIFTWKNLSNLQEEGGSLVKNFLQQHNLCSLTTPTKN